MFENLYTKILQTFTDITKVGLIKTSFSSLESESINAVRNWKYIKEKLFEHVVRLEEEAPAEETVNKAVGGHQCRAFPYLRWKKRTEKTFLLFGQLEMSLAKPEK